MRTFEKLVFTFLIAFGMLAMVKNVSASRYDGWQFIEVPSSSGNVTGLTPGKGVVVSAVYASSATTGNISEFFLLLDTNPVSSITGIGQFATGNYKAPPSYFPVSTMTATGYNVSLNKVVDYGEEGVSFSTPPYVYKSDATSGLARRVFLKLKQ